jgi:hypothetical protein
MLKLANIATRIAFSHLSTNPGVKTFKEHVENMVSALEAVEEKLDTALRDSQDIETFIEYWVDDLSALENLKKVIEQSRNLGKTASVSNTAGFKDWFKGLFKTKEDGEEEGTSTPDYSLDEKTMDDFVEGSQEWADASYYVEQEFSENKDFFQNAGNILKEFETKIKKGIPLEAVSEILDRLRTVIKKGKNIISEVRQHLVTPITDLIDRDGETPGAEESKEVIPLDKKKKKPSLIDLPSTVDHYINVLQKNLENPDKLKNSLRELFKAVGPSIEDERAVLSSKRN